MAMGACVYVRGLSGWFYEAYPINVNTTEQHIASTVVDVMGKVRTGEDLFGDPGVTRRVRSDEYVEPMLETILQEAKRGWLANMEDEGPLKQTELDRILGWMRVGYRAAERRYGCIGSSAVSYLFTKVSRQIDADAKRASEGNGAQGERRRAKDAGPHAPVLRRGGIG
jgi:hypothetical protein